MRAILIKNKISHGDSNLCKSAKSADKFLLPLLLTPLLLTSCGEEETVEPTKPRPVITFQVPAVGAENVRRFSGETEAARSVQLGFEVPGRIKEIIAVEGQRYQEGTVLARLDPATYQADLQNARAQATQAVQQLRRSQELFESGNASKADFDTAIANQKATEAALESAQLAVTYTNLIMPYEGIVADIPADPNQVVSAGTTVVAIQSDAGMDFRVGIPAENVSLIENGTKTTVTLGALPDKALTGKVTKISPLASSNTTYPVTIALENIAEVPELRAGLDGEAAFELKFDEETVLTIPASSVVTTPEGTRFVWEIASPGELTSGVKKTTVEVGSLAPEGLIQITSGLEPGMIVVTKGVHRLNEESVVSLPQ